jgi:hypothetical protein
LGAEKNWVSDNKPDGTDERAYFNGGAPQSLIHINGGKGHNTDGIVFGSSQTGALTFDESELDVGNWGITNERGARPARGA